MITLKFNNKDDELDFFKNLRFISGYFGLKVRYAELISDFDLIEKEKDKIEKEDEDDLHALLSS